LLETSQNQTSEQQNDNLNKQEKDGGSKNEKFLFKCGHTDKKYYAKGLCIDCYKTSRKEEKK
jgi:hypothetical protein